MPSGAVRCVLRVPSLNLSRELFFSFSDGTRRIRRLLHKWIPALEEAREGATFTIRAQVRHRDNQGYRWIVPGRWRAGEPINRAVEQARVRWQQLNEEHRPPAMEVPPG
jgi:hypothetical protein